MKKLLIFGIVAMFGLSSCTFYGYQCPTYSQTNTKTSHGHKAQGKYHKKSSKRNSLI